MSEKSWASTYVDYKGFKVTVTEMGDGKAGDALLKLMDTLNDIDAVPFLDRNNIMALTPAITATEPSAQMIEDAFPKESVVLDDGTTYLGMKASKPDSINENESYEVLAQTYSYDGTWVNFYNGQQDAASYYYAHKKSASIFKSMFSFEPAFVDRVLIPGGDVLLTVVGVRKDDTVYQNIKKVEQE